MKVKFEVKKIKDIKADAVVSFVFEDDVEQKMHWLNTLFKGNLDAVIQANDFKGTFGDTQVAYVNSDAKSKRLLTAGAGNSKEITLEKLRKVYAKASKRLNKLKLKTVGFEIPDLTLIKGIVPYSITDIVQAICEGVFLSQYNFKQNMNESTSSIDENEQLKKIRDLVCGKLCNEYENEVKEKTTFIYFTKQPTQQDKMIALFQSTSLTLKQVFYILQTLSCISLEAIIQSCFLIHYIETNKKWFPITQHTLPRLFYFAAIICAKFYDDHLNYLDICRFYQVNITL